MVRSLPTRTHRCGFFLVEAVLALVLMAALLLMLLTAVAADAKLDRGMADRRAATHAAERALLLLARQGARDGGESAPSTQPADVDVRVEPVTSADGAGWLAATATCGRQTVTLFGPATQPAGEPR